MTSAVELDKAMQGVAGWRGVHAVDTLGTPLRAGECAVVNLQGIAEPGSHWVACVTGLPILQLTRAEFSKGGRDHARTRRVQGSPSMVVLPPSSASRSRFCSLFLIDELIKIVAKA